MPELPEVETAVRELRRRVIGKKIIEVWTDFNKPIKHPAAWDDFKKQIRGKEIKGVRRRAKNILIDLTENKVLLIHQKMTGHLLIGRWKMKAGEWTAQTQGPIKEDSRNKFLHLIIFFGDGSQLALSDMRKFSKVEFWDREKLESSPGFKKLGPEPLDKKFTFSEFKKAVNRKSGGEIKQVLMDQNIIAGVGNIYASEILWRAGIYPFERIKNLNEKELKGIFSAVKETLKKGIELKGASYSDFRRTSGKKGGFQEYGEVYDREGKICPQCGSIVVREKQGSRSTYFCPKCQKQKAVKK